MAVVRDPAFWKRFSTAVHLEEASMASPSSPQELKHSETWLERQHKKRRRNKMLMCLCCLLFVVVIVIVVLVLIWLSRHGWFMNGEKFSVP